MHRFWDAIIHPLLEEAGSKQILEIGAHDGSNTKRVIEFCKRTDGRLISVDPLPLFAHDEWVAASEGTCEVWLETSHEAIPKLKSVDVALIDGDHNWYTVHGELTRLQAVADAAGDPFPICVFHDCGWPYDRRDQYYDCGAVPPEGQQPNRKGGVHPDHDELLSEDGMNGGLSNALKYGGEKNGVLTAIEDFLREAPWEHDWITLPGFFGLGVLIPAARRVAGGFQDRLRDHLGDVMLAGGLIADLERARVIHFIESLESQRLLRRPADRIKRKYRKLMGKGRGRV